MVLGKCNNLIGRSNAHFKQFGTKQKHSGFVNI